MSTPSQSSRPPTAFDAAERVLGRALVFGLVVLAIGIGIGVWLSPRKSAAPSPNSTPALAAAGTPAPAATTVTVLIDFGDGSQRRFSELAFTPGMSAVDAILAAQAHPRGPAVESTGSGETAFVTAVDGVRNEGGGEKARNWQFFVNDDFGRRGAGATILKPGDRVAWAFAVWQENPVPPKP